MNLGLNLSLGIGAGMASGFSPSSLFAAGEQGVWYDPSDFSTMFQDTAGTTPVTAVGQSVALIRDKSGRGNHATQATAGSRPTLQQDATGRYYLSFDGVDDGLATANLAFTASDKIILAAGVRKMSDAAVGTVCEFSSNFLISDGSFVLYAPDAAGAPRYYFGSRGTSLATSTANVTAPSTNVLTGLADIAAPAATIRVNAVDSNTSTATQGTGNYGNYPLFIGRRSGGGRAFNGRLYGMIARGGAVTADQLAQVETWLNGKTGAY